MSRPFSYVTKDFSLSDSEAKASGSGNAGDASGDRESPSTLPSTAQGGPSGSQSPKRTDKPYKPMTPPESSLPQQSSTSPEPYAGWRASMGRTPEPQDFSMHVQSPTPQGSPTALVRSRAPDSAPEQSRTSSETDCTGGCLITAGLKQCICDVRDTITGRR